MNVQRVLLALGSMALAACHANYYSTPRTLPPGKLLNIVALHAEPLPAVVYIGRVGIAERVDVGLHATVLHNRLDVKYNFLRSEFVDLAIDPNVSWGYEPIVDDGKWRGALPLLIGFNVSPAVTLMMQGGPLITQFRAPYRGYESDVPPEHVILSASVGGGVQVRIKDWLYLQPEFSLNYAHYDPQGTYYWPNIGIAMGFGPQPQYDEPKEKKN